jgi:septal ring factor EnvC (AmiA/AmiB activator)
MKKIAIVFAALVLLAGCAPTAQLKQLQAENAGLRAENAKYNSRVIELETSITSLKGNITALNEKIGLLNNQNIALGQQTADQQAKLNQNQVLLQVDQERLERLEKLLVLERAKTDDLKSKVVQTPNNATAN